ncbi:hypothetical protein GCM10010080_26560 [Thermomonas carbonis]|nr:hypothetical protein GCM10010080_26560 [Thermomonas carbonis]
MRGTDGLRQLSAGGNGQEWVLARSYCVYALLDGTSVPPRKRKGYAEMATARWSPFLDTESRVEWQGNRAMVWAWSRARALAGEADGILPPPRRIVPESLFRGQPLPAGDELVVLEEGLEGRVWRDGLLVSSCWWPEVPDLGEWNDFRRGAGLPPAAILPPPIVHPLAERMWTTRRAEGIGETFGRYRNYLALIGVGLATAVLAALLCGVLALKVSIWQVEGQIADREQALEKIILAREEALRTRDAVDAALALRPPGGQLELMALVTRLMRGNWQLLEWKMVDSQTLQLTARMANPDSRAIVSAWEASKRFTGVTAELGQQNGTVVVNAKVLPAKPQEARP